MIGEINNSGAGLKVTQNEPHTSSAQVNQEHSNSSTETAKKTVSTENKKTTTTQETVVTTFQLSKADSFQYNLTSSSVANSNYFFQNSVTQQLHPIDHIGIDNHPDGAFAVVHDSLIAQLDSLPTHSIFEMPTAEVIMPQKKVTTLKSTIAHEKDWLLGVILLAIFLLGTIKVVYQRFFAELLQTLFSFHKAHKIFVNDTVQTQKSGWLLDALFILNGSIFFSEMIISMSGSLPVTGILIFFAIAIILGFFFFIKGNIYKFLGYIFETKEQTREFLFNARMANRFFALTIFPVIVAIPFVSTQMATMLVIIGIVLFAFSYLLQIFRGMRIILQNPFSVVYMVLYLFTLEILPLSVLFKLATP